MPYDRAGYLVWFALVPLEMLVGLCPSLRGHRGPRRPPPAAARHDWWAAYGAGCAPPASWPQRHWPSWQRSDSAPASTAPRGWWQRREPAPSCSPLLIFGSREYGHTIAAAELFFIGYIYVKMLRFSRASEAISGASSLLTTMILLVSIGGFLLHGIVIYQAAFPNRRPGVARGEERRRGRREVTLFASVIIPLIVVLAMILPPDFVEHHIAFNELNELPPSPPVPVDDFSTAPPGGNLRGQQQFEPQEAPGGGQGEQQNQQEGEGAAKATPDRCRAWLGSRRGSGISAANSSNRSHSRSRGQPPRAAAAPAAPRASRVRPAAARAASPVTATRARRAKKATATRTAATGEGENRQYAVMVIASQQDPVYAADGYFGLFDGVYGFSYSREEPLNDLVHRRLFETWENPEPSLDRGRSPIEHGFFSTIPERVMAYRPLAVEPTVQQRRYHPFRPLLPGDLRRERSQSRRLAPCTPPQRGRT